MHNGRKDCTGGPSAIKCQKIGKNFRELDYYNIIERKIFREI